MLPEYSMLELNGTFEAHGSDAVASRNSALNGADIGQMSLTAAVCCRPAR
eukprot:SAG31_NODE_14259_length_818_cov_0.773296_1_plen_49_part_01